MNEIKTGAQFEVPGSGKPERETMRSLMEKGVEY